MVRTDGRPTISNAVRLPDIVVANEGTIYLVNPVSAAGKLWLEEHVDLDDAQFWGRALVVEHRYAFDLFDGMFDAGLVVA